MNRLFRAVVAALCAFALALPAAAQERDHPPVLTLEDAVSLARADQPAILAYESDALASEEAAVAARSLPDPVLTAGIQNFPIRGENAFSPTDDFMTMFTIGIMREQIRRSKREAEAERILAEALLSRRKASADERQIRREVMLAWIAAVEARAKQRLLERLIADLKAGSEVMEAGVSTGSSAPALALEADAEVAVQQARLVEAKRAERGARADLARWIGSAADRPLPDKLPVLELPASAGDGLPTLAGHPQLRVAAAEQEVAERQIEVARQDRKPDFSWSVSLGIRPEHGEMVSATVSLPWQINRSNRQDRLVSAAQARARAAQLRLQDARRELERDYRAAIVNYNAAEAEIARLEQEAVPALVSAFETAEARYAAGGGTLDQPFEIVRRYVEVTMESVEERGRRARAAAEILYILGEAGR